MLNIIILGLYALMSITLPNKLILMVSFRFSS